MANLNKQNPQKRRYCIWVHHSPEYPNPPRPVSAYWPDEEQAEERRQKFEGATRREISAAPGYYKNPVYADRRYRLHGCGPAGCECDAYVAEYRRGSRDGLDRPDEPFEFEGEGEPKPSQGRGERTRRRRWWFWFW